MYKIGVLILKEFTFKSADLVCDKKFSILVAFCHFGGDCRADNYAVICNPAPRKLIQWLRGSSTKSITIHRELTRCSNFFQRVSVNQMYVVSSYNLSYITTLMPF